MSPTLLLLLIPPILILCVLRFVLHATITTKEMLACIAFGLFVVSMTYMIGITTMTGDVEIINGQVTGKEQVRVSCSHSYKCNCHMVTRTRRVGSGKNRRTETYRVEKCDTCYEHRNDFDWRVYSSVGDFEVDRVDRQGAYTPPRWSSVNLADPVAREHGYTNYIMAAPQSLFHATASLDYKGKIPDYPRVYDYQWADRVIGNGLTVPDAAGWNRMLADSLRELGPKKQANVVIVITKEKSAMFAKALQTEWLGGKKNDVIVVIGAPNYPQIAWVDVFSWAKMDIVNVALRNAIKEQKTIHPERVTQAISDNVSRYYIRKPMEEFEYLKDDVQLPTWVMIIAFLFSTIGSLVLGWVCHKHDLFGEERTTRFSFR